MAKSTIRILWAFILLSTVSIYAQAAYRVVLDPYALSALTNNLVHQEAEELYHNKSLDSIAKRQQKIATFTATMATITEVYKVTLENVKGFGPESQYYIEIGLASYDIVRAVPRVTSAINKAKIPGKAQCLVELNNIYSKAVQLVSDFVNIVNNAKVANPLPSAAIKNGNDGYNFLDRNDRLVVANRILTDLLKLKYNLEYLETLANYANWNSLARAIDPQGWCTIMASALRAEFIVAQWNALCR